MARLIIALALCTSATAFMPSASRSTSRIVPKMAVEETSVSRRELGQSLAAAAATFGFAASASAKAGESPKFSIFGFGGMNADAQSEGGTYQMDFDRPGYSPYSVYAQYDGSGPYKKANDGEIKFQKEMFAQTEKLIAKSEGFIEQKKWEEVRTLYTQKMYNMRNSMNYLSDNVSSDTAVSRKAAKTFYASMEDTNLMCRQKKQAAAKVAYAKMMSDLNAFKATIN